jgi:hypothetical protein
MGLCLWYLATVWDGDWRVHALAAPLLILAWTAHPFPVAWAFSVAAYAALARRLAPPRRVWLVALGFAAILALRLFLTSRYSCTWSPKQIFFVTGANQLEVFGPKYLLPFAALLLLWAILGRRLFKSGGRESFFASIPIQLWIVNAAAITLIPDRVMFPQYALPFGFVTDRLSLVAALLMCASLGGIALTKREAFALLAVPAVFFGFLYADQRDLNRMEDRMGLVISRLPQQQRVVDSLFDRSLRSLCLQHDLDRACIGHCYSYGNYEAASRQFRVRASNNNEMVLSDFVDVDAASEGKYVVSPRDLPLFLIYPCGANLRDFCSRALREGESDGNPK